MTTTPDGRSAAEQELAKKLSMTKQVVASLHAVEDSAIQQVARRIKEVAALQKELKAAGAGKDHAVKVSFCCFRFA